MLVPDGNKRILDYWVLNNKVCRVKVRVGLKSVEDGFSHCYLRIYRRYNNIRCEFYKPATNRPDSSLADLHSLTALFYKRGEDIIAEERRKNFKKNEHINFR